MSLWSALLCAMRRQQKPRISTADLDRLLAGGSPGPDQRGLAALLDAAKAPASAAELAGERAAMAAYVAAYRDAVPTGAPTRKTSVRIPSLARAATMKVAAGVAVLAVGGTAVAAETGSLPSTAQHHAHNLFSGLGVPPPATAPAPSSAPPAGPGATTARPTSSPQVTTVAPRPGSPSAVPPAPAARGLCQAWHAARDKKNGKPMAAGSRRALAAMAGGVSGIPGFCASYLGGSSATPAPTPSVTSPTRPGNGSGNGNGNNGPGGSKNGEPGGNDTANAGVDGRAGPHD